MPLFEHPKFIRWKKIDFAMLIGILFMTVANTALISLLLLH